MNDKNAMISQQARSIAAAAVIGNSKTSKKNKINGITKIREVHHAKGVAREYTFVFFVGILLSIIASLCLGFLLGVVGIF